MARGVNKVILIGNVGKDPEVKYFANGDAFCNLTLATSESWNDKATGEKKERTEWHNLTFARKLAEVAGSYLRKGSKIYVEGSLKYRKYTDKEGQERYITEITVNDMQMLDGAPSGDRQQTRQPPPTAAQQQRAAQTVRQTAPPADFEDDDIPF